MTEQSKAVAGKALNMFSSIGLQMLMPSESFVNWEMATGLAFDFARVPGMELVEEGRDSRKELAQTYGEIIELIQPLISSYVETPWPGDPEPILVFDRNEWIVVNIENFKSLLMPLSQDYWEALDSYLSLSYPIGQKIMKKASAVSLTSEIGLLFGYLAKKVLAQYDFGLPKADGVIPGELFYFVEPNILGFEKRFNLDPLGVRLWIALHEVTHSFQFRAFPWLRSYINTLMQDYLRLIDKTIKDFKNDSDEGAFVFSWSSGWWKEFLGPEHKELIREIQALMCLVEGYSEHVMMHVGRQFPNYGEMVGFFKERRKRKTLAEQILEKLIGFDLKIKQYAIGEKFAAHIADKKGIAFLNRAWESKENLPSYNEIFMPNQWIKRMEASG